MPPNQREAVRHPESCGDGKKSDETNDPSGAVSNLRGRGSGRHRGGTPSVQALLALTGDRDLEIYLYNERIQISPVIPGVAILVCADLQRCW